MPGMAPNRAFFILILVGITIVLAVLLNTGVAPGDSGAVNGTLTGNVSIGPLCPVEPCRVSHEQALAAYAAHPLTITTAGGTAVATVIADPATGYQVPLRPGTYIVDTTRPGIGGTRDLPKTVSIKSGEIVWLNVSIDTGIR